MTAATRAAQLRQRGIYFFLSYAHSTPISDDVSDDPDHWVRAFYQDLSQRVGELAKPKPGMRIGFVDYELRPGSNWKVELSQALGAAEVFVPLYSQGYLTRSWPLSEREAFRQRLASAGRGTVRGHVQPVLWTPIRPGNQDPDVAAALRLGADAPAYAENGLRAMRMLSVYRNQYATVLERLAADIVRVAERSPLGPSSAPAPTGTAHPSEPTTPFLVAVHAPTLTTLPPGRAAQGYGRTAAAWRPYGTKQSSPIAEYAVNIAERLGLPYSRVISFRDEGELLSTYPGVLLVDPWSIATPEGEAWLRSALPGLPEWVTALVVIDEGRVDERGLALSQAVVDMLAGGGQNEGPESVPIARGVEQFLALMPMLVARTRRSYLRLGPSFPPTSSDGQSWRPTWSRGSDNPEEDR